MIMKKANLTTLKSGNQKIGRGKIIIYAVDHHIDDHHCLLECTTYQLSDFSNNIKSFT